MNQLKLIKTAKLQLHASNKFQHATVMATALHEHVEAAPDKIYLPRVLCLQQKMQMCNVKH